jgi:hypothetical protein
VNGRYVPVPYAFPLMPQQTNLPLADAAMNLSPQEQALYMRHITNLHGPGGVDNSDGSRSTLFQVSTEQNGKTYNVPTVYDGRILPPREAIDRANQQGIDSFPSYGSEDEAFKRYMQMHGFMDRDTGEYFRDHPPPSKPEPDPPYDPFAAEKFANPAVKSAIDDLMKPMPPDTSPVRFKTSSPLVNITEGDIDKAKDLALSFSGGGSKLFDYSKLHEVPDVPQFELPRNIPPRGVPQRTLDITNDPGVRDKMLETISQGQGLGGANWYNAEPLRAAFNQELGSGGDAAFRKYMDMVAATSPRSEVGANARNASYYYSRAMQGEPMPAVGDRNPQPYGHLAQRLHQMNAERVSSSGWDPLNNPKPASFVENLVGNQQPVTVDTHAFRLPSILAQDPRFLETAFQVAKDAPKQNIQQMVASGQVPIGDAAARPAWWQAQPKANEYAAMEKYYQGLGKDLGLTPAQTQASAWVGGGKLTGLASDESKPFLRFLEDRIDKTAEHHGVTTRQALQDFIRGKVPLR